MKLEASGWGPKRNTCRGKGLERVVEQECRLTSLVFLLTGVAMAGYLIYDAIQVRSFTTKVHNAAEPAGVLFASLREERRLTLQELATTRSLRAELDQQRRQTDEAARRMAADLESISGGCSSSPNSDSASTTVTRHCKRRTTSTTGSSTPTRSG